MAEATNQNSADNSQAGATEENKTNTQKTFTQDEVNSLIQKRIGEIQSKNDGANKKLLPTLSQSTNAKLK